MAEPLVSLMRIFIGLPATAAPDGQGRSLEDCQRRPDRVFALITDFERLPERFPARYRSVKVLQRSDGNGSNGSALVTVEEDVTVAGREMHQKTQHTLDNGSVLRSEV